ncbi:hypothetical protein FH972_005783 [Carpinus fangiana]|uniref:INO80 complex subunit B-like conserved region domain-containing protein n=1 Tax=Carpinus fangiana TaxID=176857 RepID=A0A5N6QT95_9ROSI|nr:hypothetical protein FH972_005783 [Carpinus fangiana]
MDEFGGSRYNGISNPVRKKRTQTYRRPRPDSQPLDEGHDNSPLSSTPPSDDLSKVSSEENASGDTNSRRKELNLNQCVSKFHSTAGSESEKLYEKNKKDGGFNAFYNKASSRSGFNNRRSSEGVLAPANWKNSSKLKDGFESESRNVDIYGGRNGESLSSGQAGVPLDGSGNENKVKKVKLKVGGVIRTIQANTASNGAVGGGSSSKSSRSSDASRLRQKQNLQENSDDNHSPLVKRSGLQGIPWKDFSRVGFSLVKEESLMGKLSGKSASGKQGDKFEPVRKSRRVPKRRVLDTEFGDDEEDDEIRYLEKLKTSKSKTGTKEDNEESSKKHQKFSRVSIMENGGSSRLGKDVKRSRSDRVSEDTDYEEGESGSDGELDGNKKKKQRKESVDSLMDNKREMTLTTRQRALQSNRDAAPGTSLIEFPNGLPPAPPRKQKEKLSEVEQQLKKAEAAQRRRTQVEKAARESEAEAIRKILGQESSRKKQEDKLRKRREELAQVLESVR